MKRLWCELAWLGGERAEPGVLVEVEDERVASLASRVAEAPPDAERLAGLTLPGLANAHSHAFQRGLRGRTHAGTGSFWTWREQMYELALALDPDACFAIARATFGEMALAGITCVGEFHYVHHAPDGTRYEDPNALGRAIIAAAEGAGVRLTLLDTCYLEGGIERFRDADADAWAQRVTDLEDGPGLRIGAAVHSVRAVVPEAARVVAAWANERGRPLHAHVSEQPAENVASLAAHGLTPAALLAEAGAVTERFTAIHATHVTDADIELLARGRVCLCPTTERDLGDGVGPARRLRDAGAALALGSDSNAVIDLFEEARAMELDERLVSGQRGVHQAPQLLAAATAGGYASLGWPGGGRLAPGGLADMIVVGLDSVRLAGTPPEHAVDAAVFAASAADVRHVMVGGRWIVRDGEHVAFDVTAELRLAVG